MKRSLLVILVTAVSVCAAWAQTDPNRQTIAFSDPSKPGTLNLQMANGSVTIKAYDGKTVTVESRGAATSGLTALTSPVRGVETPENKGLRRIDSNGRSVSVDPTSNTISIQTSGRQNADLLIQVPVRTNIRVNANQAKTNIEGVDGEIEVSAMSDVVLTEVSGSVLVNSMHGKVTASIRRATADKPMSFVATNGDIDVTLPPDVKASVRARTLDGEIYTGFEANEFVLQPAAPTTGNNFFGPFFSRAEDLRAEANARAAEATSQAQARGANRARVFVVPNVVTAHGFPFDLDHSAAGAINGGGPDFELRTLHGNIFIRKRK